RRNRIVRREKRGVLCRARGRDLRVVVRVAAGRLVRARGERQRECDREGEKGRKGRKGGKGRSCARLVHAPPAPPAPAITQTDTPRAGRFRRRSGAAGRPC